MDAVPRWACPTGFMTDPLPTSHSRKLLRSSRTCYLSPLSRPKQSASPSSGGGLGVGASSAASKHGSTEARPLGWCKTVEQLTRGATVFRQNVTDCLNSLDHKKGVHRMKEDLEYPKREASPGLNNRWSSRPVPRRKSLVWQVPRHCHRPGERR